MSERACLNCGGFLTDKRPDATYCNRRCKVQASDRRRLEDGRAHQRDRTRYGREAEHRKAYAREYHQARPEMVWEWRLRKRARRFGAAIYSVTYRDWTRLLARYANRCAYCGRGIELTCDHVIPLRRGGVHSIGNILPVCAPCNIRKRNKFLMEWRVSA